MSKRFILATMLALSTALTMTAYNTVRAQAEDDVFVDEGDGDFDAVPPVAEPAKESPKANTKQADVPPPAPVAPSAIDEAFDDPSPPTLSDDSMPADMEAPADMEEPSALASKKPKAQKAPKAAKAQKAPKAKKVKVAKAKSSKPGKGKFVTTKSACKAVREPASTDTLFTTAASKKIWVEVVDSEWVRGFNKAGEAGYISTDCVE